MKLAGRSVKLRGADWQEERWAYAGLRIVRGGPVQAWLVDAGEGDMLFFPPEGEPVVGEIYRARVSRNGSSVVLHGQPVHEGDGRIRPDLAARLLAEDRIAATRLAVGPLLRETGRRDELELALDPLREIACRLSSQVEREAFVAYVLHELVAPGSDKLFDL
jgi:hypothetical protein